MSVFEWILFVWLGMALLKYLIMLSTYTSTASKYAKELYPGEVNMFVIYYHAAMSFILELGALGIFIFWPPTLPRQRVI